MTNKNTQTAPVDDAATEIGSTSLTAEQDFAGSEPANGDVAADLLTAKGRIEDLETENGKLTEERDDAIARAEKAEAALKAKPKAVTAKSAEPKARKFGRIKPDDTLTDEQRRTALREDVQNADEVEIAFVDARGHEIAGSKPVTVTGDVWKDHAVGLMQSEPIEIVGEGVGYSIAGYALVLDGKHRATQMRSERINIAPGQRVKLVDDIAF